MEDRFRHDLYVGDSGAGALSITAGGTVSNSNANIGAGSGSSGTVTVDGAGSVWTNNSVLAVGSAGTGSLYITGGGVVSSTNGRIARSAGSYGVVLIDGLGSRWNASGVFTMGLQGTGPATLDVRNGGVLSAAGGMTIGPLGTVRGDGTIVGNVNNAGGVAAPGTSPGTLHINGSYEHFAAALQIELASPASFDKLDVTGNITLYGDLFGGVLDVSLLAGYVPHGSQSFDILDWGGSLTGTFSSIRLPTLGGTLAWDTSQLYINGILSVTGPPAPAGDYNANGTVDAADYIVWRKGLGTTYTQNDYNVWRSDFGQTMASGAGAGQSGTSPGAVPEPAAAMLLLFGLLAAAIFCRPRVTIG